MLLKAQAAERAAAAAEAVYLMSLVTWQATCAICGQSKTAADVQIVSVLRRCLSLRRPRVRNRRRKQFGVSKDAYKKDRYVFSPILLLSLT